MDADDEEDDVDEPVFVTSVATPAVEVTTLVIVDPPASVEVTTDVTTA